MSLLNWFTPKPKPEAPAQARSRQEGAGGALGQAGGANAGEPNAAGPPASRKSERMARRESLYGLLRESMIRAGILSASYKYKVLSLDGRGRQFLVMMELTGEDGADRTRLAEIEAMIIQAAEFRADIAVKGVYWRFSGAAAKVAVPGASKARPVQALLPAPVSEAAEPACERGAHALAFDGAAQHGPQSYTLLTGFENTETPDSRAARPS